MGGEDEVRRICLLFAAGEIKFKGERDVRLYKSLANFCLLGRH